MPDAVTYSIAWNRRRQESRKNPDRDRRSLECTLLERVLVEGRPAFKFVRRLASIPEDETESVAETERFWSACALRLGKLRRLTERDRWHIESLIAQKIPKPRPYERREARRAHHGADRCRS